MFDKLSILIIDDEKRLREEIIEFLSGYDLNIDEAGLPSEAYCILQNKHIDIVILDLKLPEEDGITVLKNIKSKYPEIEVIMITGHGDMNLIIDAMRNGASDFFNKPFRLSDVYASIERTKKFISLSESFRRVKKNYNLVYSELQKRHGYVLIAESKPMKHVIELMSKVAQSDRTPVLITGETGTGKELVARGIHVLSARNKNYFHAVNCSAIPESLFESELFGHKRGAFTDAKDDKPGWFEIANNGCLFLDEIGDMPASHQGKLLRVIEDQKITKLGEHNPLKFDVKIIAATHQNISNKAIFREDLYHRLSTFTIHLPPLRERKEDIPHLVNHFIHYYALHLKKSITNIDDEVMQFLEDYPFPGNVRELRNMIERAVILCDSDTIHPKHFHNFNQEPGKNQDGNILAFDDLDLQKAEEKLIQTALQRSGSNKTQAAKLLNITWQSLDRRMKKLNLD